MARQYPRLCPYAHTFARTHDTYTFVPNTNARLASSASRGGKPRARSTRNCAASAATQNRYTTRLLGVSRPKTSTSGTSNKPGVGGKLL